MNALRLVLKRLQFAIPVVTPSRSIRRTLADMSQDTSGKKQEKVLLAFDFDHTVIDDNSDTYITKLAPSGKIPPEIKSLYSDHGWTNFMREIFRYLHQNNTTPEQILKCMTEIGFSPGMVDLLRSLDPTRTETIIISDANSIFIDHILNFHGLRDRIHRVYTNPAQFLEDGRLDLQMYHFQQNCSLSTVNLCKGQILESYIEERTKDNVAFTHVAFVGDGHNDFCPSLRLSDKDFVFPREGFSLVKYIKKMETEQGLRIKANVHTWSSGHDILKVLSERIPLLAPTDI